MANEAHFLLLFLVMLSAMHFVAAHDHRRRVSNTISRGSSLTPTGNSSWLSPSGLFAFGFYPQGHNRYGVGIILATTNKTVVWTANRDYPPVSDNVTLRFTKDGRLVLQQQSQEIIWQISHQNVSSASVLDSGNFVLFDCHNRTIWQSFDEPTDTILPGQILSEDQELSSSISESDYSTGIFRLKLQFHSNLVLYPANTVDRSFNSYWSTNVPAGVLYDVTTLNLNPDGHLFLLRQGSFVEATRPYILANLTQGFNEKQRLYLMKFHFDGILRLYSVSLDGKGKSSSVVWESSKNRCDPKGSCGLNGYCTLTEDDDEPKCLCPRGFNYVSPGNRNEGCERNYTVHCGSNKERMIQYSMTQLEHTWWENDPDSVVQMRSKEECEAACLEDCECEAALYKDGDCKKLSLPLRYGRSSMNDSTVAFTKWALPPPGNMTKNSRDKLVFPVLAAGSGGGLALMLVFLVIIYCGVRQCQRVKNKKLKENFFERNGGIILQQLLYQSESILDRARIYTEEELKKATNNFNESNVIGQGGYGVVYKGVIADKVYAIKKSKVVDRSQVDQFVNEVILLWQINHPNVVKLLGCCLETPVPLLVYEFVTNNTLFHHLHDQGLASSIPWTMRLKIATETAGALAHLHSAPVHIIHRDIKSANILLEDGYSVKVSDFGVSRLFSPQETHLATLVQGTFGYIDPEYFHSGILTQKSDVYSFGVVLAELLTGAKVVSFLREAKDRNLGMYFLSALDDDRLYTILEPRVRNEGNAEQLEGVAEIAKKCLSIEGAKRPTMMEVAEELAELRELRIDDHLCVEVDYKYCHV